MQSLESLSNSINIISSSFLILLLHLPPILLHSWSTLSIFLFPTSYHLYHAFLLSSSPCPSCLWALSTFLISMVTPCIFTSGRFGAENSDKRECVFVFLDLSFLIQNNLSYDHQFTFKFYYFIFSLQLHSVPFYVCASFSLSID